MTCKKMDLMEEIREESRYRRTAIQTGRIEEERRIKTEEMIKKNIRMATVLWGRLLTILTIFRSHADSF